MNFFSPQIGIGLDLQASNSIFLFIFKSLEFGLENFSKALERLETGIERRVARIELRRIVK